MARAGWGRLAIVGLLMIGLGGCAHEARKPPAQARAAPATPADRARSAADRAAHTEQALSLARQHLQQSRQAAAQAEQQRAQARQQLSQAEQRAFAARQRAAQEQANVDRLAVAAREQRQVAEDEAVRAQLAAEEAEGLRTAEGRIAEASPSQLVLDVQGGGTMAFQVDQRTRVLVGTEERSLADLQQGADVRVAYDPHAPEPAAVTIHVTPAHEQTPLAAPVGQSPQSQ